jgi:hypothetical protein
MAGNKLNTKLSASNILEVIVSMVIIVIVFGIAMMIYSNVLRFSLSAKKAPGTGFIVGNAFHRRA